jgi:hypothetical protein
MKSKRNKNSNPVFPEINYDYWSKRPSWEDRSSIPGMITILKNQKLIDHSTTAGNITERIKAAIAQYLNDRKNSEALKLAFIYIQAWGGLSARIYTPQIITNWEAYSFKYENAVNLILECKYTEVFNLLKKGNGKIRGLGISFIPKHICFWSGKGSKDDGVPILDDVISKMIYNKGAKDVQYEDFINHINQFSTQKNLASSQVETALFSFAQNYWQTIHTRSKIFHNSIKDKTDWEIAMKIANLM